MKTKMSIKQTGKNPFSFLAQLAAKIDNWLFLERFFLCLILCMILLIAWYTLFMLPLKTKMNMAEQNLTVTQQSIQKLTEQSKQMSEDAQRKIETDKQKFKELSQETEKLDKQISRLGKTFGGVSEAADLLRTTLDKHPKLRLKNLATLPTVEIIQAGDDPETLVNHGVAIQFIGGYFHTLAYLKELEKSQRQLFWKSLTYHVTQYPDAEVAVTFSLLDKQHKKKRFARSKNFISKGNKAL